MKKILFAIILFGLFIKNINAETIYGNYYKVDSLLEEKEDEVKIVTYKFYNTYKVEYEDMGYLQENQIYYKDENDFIYENIINDSLKGDEFINLNLNALDKEKVSIKLGNITFNSKIYELELYYKGEKVDYIISNKADIEVNNATINNISDNNLETYYTHKTLDYLNIKFSEKYNMEDLEIILHTKKSNNISFLFYFNDRPKIILHNDNDRKHIIKFKTVEENDGETEYFYVNNIKLYKYYKEKIVKLNVYIKDGNNLILDDYKEINEYYKRDKLVLNDYLVIDSKEKKIEDLIEYSTGNVNILYNLNYEVNGNYTCKFILNDIIVEKDVVINIDKKEEDKSKEVNKEKDEVYEEKNEALNKEELIHNNDSEMIKEDIESINNKKEVSIVNKKEDKNKEIKKEEIKIKKSTTKVIKNKINNLSKNNNKIVNKHNIKEEEIMYVNDNVVNDKKKKFKISLVLIAIVLIILRIFLLIKRKRNSVESI